MSGAKECRRNMRCSATPLVDHDSLCHPTAMAIQFARARYIARSSGGSAVRSAAYNARDAITAERTGELFYFKHRDAPEHHEVLLPDGAEEKFRRRRALWNAAEAAERRKDAQVAREIVMALPANAEVSNEDRIELARSFALEHFVAKGLGGSARHARAAWRRSGERAGELARASADHDPADRGRASRRRRRGISRRRSGRRARGPLSRTARTGARCGATIRTAISGARADRRVDATATHARSTSGRCACARPRARPTSGAEIARANGEAARDPEQVLATLTRNNATFTERDLDRHLAKHLPTRRSARALRRRCLSARIWSRCMTGRVGRRRAVHDADRAGAGAGGVARRGAFGPAASAACLGAGERRALADAAAGSAGGVRPCVSR